MKTKLLSTLAGLTILASASYAANPNFGTYYGDGYLFGSSNVNTEGYVSCEWTGFAAPFTPNVPGFRLVIWSEANAYLVPIYTEEFWANPVSTNYFRDMNVPAGYRTTVEVYAAGNQYANSPTLNWCYVDAAWIRNR